ncbi:MAG: DUF4342 domain-containing protein [Candidatus Promineifilaceae bacterium]
MSEEHIHIEEESIESGAKGDGGRTFSEEFRVTGAELVDAVKRLVQEAGVRRIVIKNRNDRELLRIPLVVGVAGIALAPFYASLALIAALVADCKIVVERTAPAEPASV